MSAVFGILSVVPLVLIVLNIVWCLRTQRAWGHSTLLALSFYSLPFVFAPIRSLGPYPGGADIGAGLLIVLAPVLTIRLAFVGIALGRRLNRRRTLFAALAIVMTYVGLSFWYVHNVRRYAADIERRSVLNCATMAFHCAVRDKRLADIADLRAKGYDIEAKDGFGYTALLYYAHDLDAVSALLDSGANPNQTDLNGYTSLAKVLGATSQLNLAVADQLLKHGANLNQKYGSGKQMLILTDAVIRQDAAVINYALAHGADPALKDDYGYDACERATLHQSVAIGDLTRICAR